MSGPIDFVLHLETLSDLHVGSGLAAGTIDASIARDADGLPEIPATTLRGLLRDSAEQIATALDARDGSAGWTQLVTAMFGSQPALGATTSDGPLPGALSVRGARLPEGLHAQLREPELRAVLTGTRSQVAIDRASGTAGDDLLRTLEVVRPGLRFVAEVRLDGQRLDGAGAAAHALLAAAAAITTRVGGGRRRGLGRVTMRLVAAGGADPGRDEFARLLSQPAPSSSATASVAVDAEPDDVAGVVESAALVWHAIGLRMTTVDPILVPRRTAGNVAESYDHVPGRVLLPLVAQALSALGADAGAAIGGGLLRVTDATPEVGARAGAPVPFCFAGPVGGDEVTNRLDADPQPGSKPFRGGFLVDAADGAVEVTRTSLSLHMHNSVDDASGRVGDAESGGGLFGVSAIDAGTILRFHVLVATGAGIDPMGLATALVGPASIGTARRGAYGRVMLEADALEAGSDPVEWRTSADIEAGATLTLWLVSDCVLLDDRTLAPSPTRSALIREVELTLGLSPGTLVIDDDRWVHTRTARHDAWHARWGTPRATLPTLAAGSVVRVRTSRPIAGAALDTLALHGLGERRAEGFGRIAIDPSWSTRQVLELRRLRRDDGGIDGGADAPAMTGSDQQLLDELRAEALRRRTAGLVEAVGRPGGRGRVHPLPLSSLSRAQRGLLRAVAARAAAAGDVGPLRAFVESVQERASRRGEKAQRADEPHWIARPEQVATVDRLAVGDAATLQRFTAWAEAAGIDVPDAELLAAMSHEQPSQYARLVAGLLTASVRAAEGSL